jgi:hypothetical protein
MGPIGCTETSVSKYHSTVRETPKNGADLIETAARDGNYSTSPLLESRMYIIIRRYTDQRKFAACMAVWSITFISYFSGSILYHCIYGCVFCMLLFNFANYVFLFLCILIIMLYILIVMFVQGVTGGTDQTSGGCSLC